jgi:hypothetical protein
MFFPWVGLIEQICLADVFVHYDDVQFSKGSFTNRVQIKTARGVKWLTVPVRLHLGDLIQEVQVSDEDPWREGHLALLAQAFEGAPYVDDALRLVKGVYESAGDQLCSIAISSMEAVLRYFGLAEKTQFVRSSQLDMPGKSWQRVLDIVRRFGGDTYITGHGARNYMDHEAFENAGVKVEYIDYRKRPYPQLHGEFTPFVSVLDLIANTGKGGREYIGSPTKPWREFLSVP